MTLTDQLAAITTEAEFLRILPELVKSHGREEVEKALHSFLTPSQAKECFKRLASFSERITWVSCTSSASPATVTTSCDELAGELRECSLVITDTSLNEVARGSWKLGASALSRSDAARQVVDFISTHSARGTSRLAGVGLARKEALLARTLPSVLECVDRHGGIDLGDGGVARFAAMLQLPLIEDAPTTRPPEPRTLAAFEAAMRLGRSPVPNDDALDRNESAIVALGWARQHFIAPPKGAKYVTAGLYCYSALLLGSIAHVSLSFALEHLYAR